MGVSASNLLVLFRLVSWLPVIIIVGLILANLFKNSEVISINSGDISVLLWTISPAT